MSGIKIINRNGLRWRDALAECESQRTLNSRWKRWIEMGIFAGLLLELADRGGETNTLKMDRRI